MGQRVTWNNPSFFTSIHAFVPAAGTTIAPDGPVTAAALAGFDSFLIAVPSRATTASESAALSAFVTSGGLLLLMMDRDALNSNFIVDANIILADVGSSIRVQTASMTRNVVLESGVFATISPNNIGGGGLTGTPGRMVTGGTALTRGGAGWTPSQAADAAAYIHWEQIGSGYVFVFGDRLDHNFFSFTTTGTRGKLFENLTDYVKSGAPPAPSDVPEPSTALLAAAGLTCLLLHRGAARRRR